MYMWCRTCSSGYGSADSNAENQDSEQLSKRANDGSRDYTLSFIGHSLGLQVDFSVAIYRKCSPVRSDSTLLMVSGAVQENIVFASLLCACMCSISVDP